MELVVTCCNDCSPTTKNSCLAMELGTPSVELGLKSRSDGEAAKTMSSSLRLPSGNLT